MLSSSALRFPLLAAAILATLAASLFGSEKDEKPDRSADVDRLFTPWNRPDVPGGAVGVLRDGKLIYSKGFGSANLEDEVPNSPQTVFEIASASKSFTAACIALLMDQGKLRPDDELSRFVPEMHKFDPPIRLRHLIQCRTGLWEPVHIMPLAGWDNLPTQYPYSEADLFTVLCGQKKLPFALDSKFHYGSGDYYALGRIVRSVTGKSLAQFARENFFEPLGMTRTFFEEDTTRVVKGRAIGHYRQDGVWHQWSVHNYHAGPGGLNTCIEDLARWDQNFDDSRLPKGKYLDEFFSDGTVLGNRYVLDADAYRKYVYKDDSHEPMGRYRGLKRIQFTGGMWGMSAAISRFPEQRLTVICLSNNDELSPFAKTRQIAELYLGDVMQPLPTAAPASGEPKEFVTLPPADLENKVAAYRLVDEGRVWKVALRSGDLYVIDPLLKSWKLNPLSATRFRPAAGSPFYDSARFLFHRDAPDQPFSMTLESNERGFREVLPFRRVELVDPPPEKLADYSGEYVSDELVATYRFAVREDTLCLRLGSRRWERLTPTVADEFIPYDRTLHDNRIITFRRDSNGRVTSLSISFWRVPAVDFQKRP